MATHLWLLRHGEAEPHDARPDADRRLTARGEEQARAAGRALVALETPVHTVFTSPKVRAAETARLACEALGVEPIVERSLAAGAEAGDARLLAITGERVLLVGHEPDFSQIVYDLTGARIDLKKGGLAGIRMDGGSGELVVLLRPREVARLAA